MERVAVVDGAMTSFGEHWNLSLRELAVEAGRKAMKNAGVGPKDVDALFIGNMAGGFFNGQEHLASLLSRELHLAPKPSTRVESACASGGLAARMGYLSILAGAYDTVLCLGVEKMTDLPPENVTSGLAMAADGDWEAYFGVTFPALYAMLARRHMHEFGTTEEQMAAVAVKNHENGALNPHSQFKFPLTIEKVLKSTLVSDPLRLMNCSPISDGAAAVVISKESIAKKLTDTPVYFQGSGQGSDSIALHNRASLTTLDATVAAGRMAFKNAKLTPKDIDLVEVHDCFTIAELLAIEDLGFIEKGKAGPATEEGVTARDGKIPVNASGGLKAKGHPVGATGIAQIYEAMLQLRSEAGGRQVDGATRAMTHNVGGSGGTAIVNILGRD